MVVFISAALFSVVATGITTALRVSDSIQHDEMIKERDEEARALQAQHNARMKEQADQYKKNVQKLEELHNEAKLTLNEKEQKHNELKRERDIEIMKMQQEARKMMESSKLHEKRQSKMLTFIIALCIAIVAGIILLILFFRGGPRGLP